MNKEFAIKIMQDWYFKRYVKFEIVKNFLVKREFSMLIPKCFKDKSGGDTRYMRVLNWEGLDYAMLKMVKYVAQDKAYNLYYSLAKYDKGLPQFSHVLAWRKADTDKWRDGHWKQMVSYDLLIDVDCPDLVNGSPDRGMMKVCKDDTSTIVQFLDSLQVPYYLRFSGAGYHIVIPHQFFNCVAASQNFNPEDPNSVFFLFNDITQFLYDTFTELVDIGLHDSRRILKIPYSICFYPDGCFICYPFNNKVEFMLNSWEDYKLDDNCHFPGETKIFNRGQTLYNENSINQSIPCTNFLKVMDLDKWLKDETSNSRE